MKYQLLVRLYAQLPKILNIEQDVLLPAPVLVLVLNHVLPHGLLQVGENQDYFVEGFFRDMSNITVVLRLDIGCAPVLSLNKPNLAKVLSGRNDSHEGVLPVLVGDGDLALAFGNEVEVLS